MLIEKQITLVLVMSVLTNSSEYHRIPNRPLTTRRASLYLETSRRKKIGQKVSFHGEMLVDFPQESSLFTQSFQPESFFSKPSPETSYYRPFGRNCHKIPLHRICKTGFVEGRLNDCRGFTTDNHRETLSNTLHLLQNIILPHKVNDSNH